MRINEKLGTLLTLLMEQSWHPESVTVSRKRMELAAVKEYLDGICTVALQIGAQDSCLLHGRLMKEQNAASFDMNDIETITEAE